MGPTAGHASLPKKERPGGNVANVSGSSLEEVCARRSGVAAGRFGRWHSLPPGWKTCPGCTRKKEVNDLTCCGVWDQPWREKVEGGGAPVAVSCLSHSHTSSILTFQTSGSSPFHKTTSAIISVLRIWQVIYFFQWTIEVLPSAFEEFVKRKLSDGLPFPLAIIVTVEKCLLYFTVYWY